MFFFLAAIQTNYFICMNTFVWATFLSNNYMIPYNYINRPQECVPEFLISSTLPVDMRHTDQQIASEFWYKRSTFNNNCFQDNSNWKFEPEIQNLELQTWNSNQKFQTLKLDFVERAEIKIFVFFNRIYINKKKAGNFLT